MHTIRADLFCQLRIRADQKRPLLRGAQFGDAAAERCAVLTSEMAENHADIPRKILDCFERAGGSFWIRQEETCRQVRRHMLPGAPNGMPELAGGAISMLHHDYD